MKKNKHLRFLSVSFTLLLTSCAVSYENFTVNNRNHLALLEAGMSKLDVNQIMGNKPIKGIGAHVGNPYKTELFKTTNGESITIFWYYSQMNSANGHVDDDELTPVVFKNGKMEGYGWSFYRDTHQHIDINQKIQITND